MEVWRKMVGLTVYRNSEQYTALVEESIAIFQERLKNSREELILGYGQLGERIANDPLYKDYGNGELIKTLAEDTRLSESTIYRAVQFYNQYHIVSPTSESWNKFEEGQNISWNKIKTKYLPEQPGKEDRPTTHHHCPNCGFDF